MPPGEAPIVETQREFLNKGRAEFAALFAIADRARADTLSRMGLFGMFGNGKGNSNPENVSGFPFEVLKIPGKEAVDRTLAWREEWRGQFTPVILGGKELDRLQEQLEDAQLSPDEIIAAAESIDVRALLDQRMQDNYSLEAEDDPLGDVTNPDAWNIDAGPLEIVSVKEILSRKFFPSVFVAKIPTGQPFETPAYLGSGGWNECPSAEEQVAVWKYWQDKYGAEILCATADVIEATVQRPPVSKEDCYALAREQFAFCSDIVTQGVGSIDALAATLRNGPCWYFWWD